MREFVSLESLARVWKVEAREIHAAADAAGILLFTLHGHAHADKVDLLRLGEAVYRDRADA